MFALYVEYYNKNNVSEDCIIIDQSDDGQSLLVKLKEEQEKINKSGYLENMNRSIVRAVTFIAYD